MLQVPPVLVNAASARDNQSLYTRPINDTKIPYFYFGMESLKIGNANVASVTRCFYCGGKMHQSRSQCPAREAVCHHYNTKGDYAKACRKKRLQLQLWHLYNCKLSSQSHYTIDVKLHYTCLSSVLAPDLVRILLALVLCMIINGCLVFLIFKL